MAASVNLEITVLISYVCLLYAAYAGHSTPVTNATNVATSSADDWQVDVTTHPTLVDNTTVTQTSVDTSTSNSTLPDDSLPSIANTTDVWPDYVELCPSSVLCYKLGADCVTCELNTSCRYGENISTICHVKPHVVCTGEREFQRWFNCRYCYQTHESMHHCTTSMGCPVATAPLHMYEANCTVKDDVICLGRRHFSKMRRCNWTSGKHWPTALILSITLGGFGADRFYLGLWREGIGKLFSFGGLGVWTIVDVILVATGYIGPADGSLYIV